MQGHFHLDKSIVSWKESLTTTQCILYCPYYTWGMSKNKNKTAWPLSITNPVLSYFLYIFAHCFTSKLRQIKGERQGSKKKIKTLIKKMYSSGLELMTFRSTGRRSNHFAMKDSRFDEFTFLIYRQPIFNTDKTVSRQSELFVCRSTF